MKLNYTYNNNTCANYTFLRTNIPHINNLTHLYAYCIKRKIFHDESYKDTTYYNHKYIHHRGYTHKI